MDGSWLNWDINRKCIISGSGNRWITLNYTVSTVQSCRDEMRKAKAHLELNVMLWLKTSWKLSSKQPLPFSPFPPMRKGQKGRDHVLETKIYWKNSNKTRKTNSNRNNTNNNNVLKRVIISQKCLWSPAIQLLPQPVTCSFSWDKGEKWRVLPHSSGFSRDKGQKAGHHHSQSPQWGFLSPTWGSGKQWWTNPPGQAALLHPDHTNCTTLSGSLLPQVKREEIWLS